MDILKYRIFLALMCAVTSSGQVFEVHPKNATVMEGDDHHLQCKFSRIIEKCTWIINGKDPVTITGRYQYLDSITKGKNTKNCSIVIRGFQSHDVHEWQCSLMISPENPNHEGKSDKAYLKLEKRPNPKSSETPTTQPTENEEKDNFLGLGLSKINAIVLFAGGISLLIIIIGISIIFCKRKKGKKTDPSPEFNHEEVMFNNMSGSHPALSHNNLLKTSLQANGSTLSICTNCHQLVADPSTPESLRSTPRSKQRDKLPDHAYNDGTAPNISSKHLQRDSYTSMPSIPETSKSCQTRQDLSGKSPMVKNFSAISPPTSPTSASTTTNPLYEYASGYISNKETRVFFPSAPNIASAKVPANKQSDSIIKNEIKAKNRKDSPEAAPQKDETTKTSPKSNKNARLKKAKRPPEVPDSKDLYENLKYRGSHIL